MLDRNEIEKTVLTAIAEYNQQVPEDEAVSVSRDSVLFGEGGVLDSMGLVNLILCVEQQVAEDWGQEVSISDEKAMSQRTSPFRTVGTLVDYVVELLDPAAVSSRLSETLGGETGA